MNTESPLSSSVIAQETVHRVWKVGSRWSDDGDPTTRIYDIFRRHQVVFVGPDRATGFNAIRHGDLIVVADGLTTMGLGIAMTDAMPLRELKIPFTEAEWLRFDHEDECAACRLSLVHLDQESRPAERYPSRSAVNEVHGSWKESFIALHEEQQRRYEEERQFEIKASSCTLLRNTTDPNDILWEEDVFFEVPVYQRPYSWGEEQIRRLLSDLISSFLGRGGFRPREPMFIGTMQLTARETYGDGSNRPYHQVIDGQQRLSTLCILLKALQLLQQDLQAVAGLKLNERLRTTVSGGVQQGYLEAALDVQSLPVVPDGLNPYLTALNLLVLGLQDAAQGEIADDLLPEETSRAARPPLEFGSFADYVLSRVYFVVIRTRATLSKTLQIFDAINTSGMDLNGGDVFKIRFYDYLREKQRAPEGVFGEIDALYQEIDQKNHELNGQMLHILGILSLLQHRLIPAFGLPVNLHTFAPETFFERFFDTVLNIRSWKNFTSAGHVSLDVTDVRRMIKAAHLWQTRIPQLSAEAHCGLWFIDRSRYGRFSNLPVLFQERFQADVQQTGEFLIQLTRLLIIHSLIRRRITYEGTSLMDQLQEMLFAPEHQHLGQEDILVFLREASEAKRLELEHVLLTEPLADNARGKYLVCRLSAMLEELGHETFGEKGDISLHHLLFVTDQDVEHIESVNHPDGTERTNIHEKWKNHLHHIGNLILLERSPNRSISNSDYTSTKRPVYRQSGFRIVKKLAEAFPEWNFDHCEARKHSETTKLVAYLCDGLTPS